VTCRDLNAAPAFAWRSFSSSFEDSNDESAARSAEVTDGLVVEASCYSLRGQRSADCNQEALLRRAVASAARGRGVKSRAE